MTIPQVDWTNPNCPVTTHFTVKDACFLHNWNRLATIEEGMDTLKLETLCKKLEEIRTLLNVPMNIHSMFRSEKYNQEQKIFMPTGRDVHALSCAADFDCAPHLTIEQVKEILIPKLEELGIRLEYGTTNWVHLDLRAPGPSSRYFHV